MSLALVLFLASLCAFSGTLAWNRHVMRGIASANVLTPAQVDALLADPLVAQFEALEALVAKRDAPKPEIVEIVAGGHGGDLSEANYATMFVDSSRYMIGARPVQRITNVALRNMQQVAYKGSRW